MKKKYIKSKYITPKVINVIVNPFTDEEIENFFTSKNVIGTTLEDNVEDGFFTIEQYSEKTNISPRTIQRKIKLLYKTGNIQIKFYNVNNILGQKRKTPHYKIIENPNVR